MQFHVARLQQEPVGSTRHHVIEHDEPVQHADVTLTRLRGSVLLQFDGEMALDQECARCLTPFGSTVPVAFEEMYYERPEYGAEAPTDDPDAFYIDDRHIIDITEAVRQYRELAASLQPLCRDDCPGLCPECGTDLTMGTCNCDRTPIDPRFAALAALRQPPEG